MAGTADPTDSVVPDNVWLEGLMWGTEWGSGAAPGEATEVAVYVAGQDGAETITSGRRTVVTALAPTEAELAAITDAMASIEAVCLIDFQLVDDAADADIVWVAADDEDADGAYGWANPPGTATSLTLGDEQSLVVFNTEGYVTPAGQAGHLAVGGFDYITFIHELGHAVGLAHPHDQGGGSSVFPGVDDPFTDTGDLDMNQGVNTMMTYIDGWVTAPHGLTPADTYGYEAGPMALDVAALQAMYGANMATAAGDDAYLLPTVNAVGTCYTCIWDAGGTDRITGGDAGNTIDLRAATLEEAAGGGGYVSFAAGIHGGFTIADGVVIENATGGDARDTLRGNTSDNLVSGLGGDDHLGTYAGDDVLRGDGGADVLEAGAGLDELRGGDGNDRLNGGDNDDRLFGGNGDDVLTGGLGRDTLEGNGGADDFVFVSPSESGPAAPDRILGFVRGQDDVVLSQVDANAGVAGNQGFTLDAGGAFAAGEIRQRVQGSDLVLELNLDADATVEMTIVLQGVTSPLAASDFLL